MFAHAPCLFCFRTIHSGLGTHISFVRSVAMDRWTDREIAFMKAAGGNDASRQFLEQHGLNNFGNLSAREKYDSPQAELYRQVLKARVDGTLEPTTLPETTQKTTSSNTSNNSSSSSVTKSSGKKKMEGFGSSPAPRSDTNDRATDIKRCLYVTATVVLGAALWVVVPH